jgi:hypothetical protein
VPDQNPRPPLGGGDPPGKTGQPDRPPESDQSQPDKGQAAKDRPVKERSAKDRAAKREEFERTLKSLTADQKRELGRVNRFVLGFGGLALVTMIALTMPLPWPAVGLVAMLTALIVAIRGIRAARRTPLAGGAVTYLTLGLVLLGMFAFYCIPLVTTWEEQWDYQRCLEQTQTIEGADACRAAFEKATESDWRRLLQSG